MTVAQALAQWMQDNGIGVRGTDIFIGSAPLDAPTACYWIIGGGGTPVIRAQTGGKGKAYIFNVFYRNTDASDVDSKLQALEELANRGVCYSLSGYDTLDIEASSFQSDNDLDLEDRAVGTVQITVTVYQAEVS